MPPNSDYDVLFEPVQIGPKTAPNRFYQVPHCNGMGYMRPRTHAAMRGVKAEGGWGVVCTEYCSIHPSSDDSPFAFAALWDDEDVRAYALMVDKVHAHGALAGVQLWYGGSYIANLMSRDIPLDVDSYPSSFRYDPVQSRAMDKRDIRQYKKWHADAVRRAMAADFDIVYVYATHGYLMSHFLSRKWNTRSDEYGGSLENRLRLVRELIEETREIVSDRCAVAVRFSTDSSDSREGHIENSEQREMFAMLADLPDIWDVNIADYAMEMGSSRFTKEAAQEDYVAYVKKITDKPVVGVGRFTSPDTMLRQVKKGILDFIGAARPSIADPFLPEKIRKGRYEDIRECIGCNICYAFNTRCVPSRCTQNPTFAEEYRRGWHPEKIEPAASKQSVLIVGAGPAGLEAARALGRRGYAVTLAEATTELGGRVLRESALPGLNEWRRVVEYRIQQLKKMSTVAVYRSSDLSAADILSYDFACVAVATGSRWRKDGVGRWHVTPVASFDAPNVFTPDDVMAGADIEGPVVVFDDDHYYMGAVMARQLLQKGLRVRLVTPAGRVGEWSMNTDEQARTQAQLLTMGADVCASRAVTGMVEGGVETVCVYTGRRETLPAASLVTVTSRRPLDALYRDLMSDVSRLQEKGIQKLTCIGDACAPGLIAAAVYAGHLFAREVDAPAKEGVSFKRERPVV